MPNLSILYAAVCKCASTPVLAFYTKLAHCNAALAVNTGTSVNVLFVESFLALKRASRCGRYTIDISLLHLTGVNADIHHILGVVRVPVRLEKGIPVMNLHFHVLLPYGSPVPFLLTGRGG